MNQRALESAKAPRHVDISGMVKHAEYSEYRRLPVTQQLLLYAFLLKRNGKRFGAIEQS